MIFVNGHRLNIDIRTELEHFDWVRPNWSNPNKLIAASPFRYDRSPSFFVNLKTGGWCDSGATDPQWESGDLVSLLSFIRQEDPDTVRDYLCIKYGHEQSVNNELTIRINLPKDEIGTKPIDMSVLSKYKFRHPYLGRRGISEEVQRKMQIGYDKSVNAVTIPWFLPNGQLANIKYRRTDSKIFWYYRGGIQLRHLLYGINAIYKERSSQAVLVEGEVDALTCMTAGWQAIAIGGSAFTDEKAELIKRSPIERIIIATDNDVVGTSLKNKIFEKLSGYVELCEVTLPSVYKDVNEVNDINDLSNFLRSAKVINGINVS